MRFGIDLDEQQVNATCIVADKLGLTMSETCEMFVLMGVQEVVLGLTKPGMTPAEVSRRMREHSDRLILELKGRRIGGSVGPT